jgi:sialate O-acetylesterase
MGKQILCLLAWFILSKTYANVKPNNVFSSNMVLQRNEKVPVWGTADDGEKVKLSFNGQEVSTVATQGKWIVWLNPMSANDRPQTMEIIGKNKVTFRNILIGEVWFCAGQSNMEMFVGKYKIYRGVKNFEEELKDVQYPAIRLLQIPHYSSGLPMPETNCTWMNMDSTTVYWTSAVAWFFAKKISKELHVPVGLINASWGGSPIQVWTPSNVFKESSDFELEKEKLTQGAIEYNASTHLAEEDWKKKIAVVMDTLSVEPPSEKYFFIYVQKFKAPLIYSR